MRFLLYLTIFVFVAVGLASYLEVGRIQAFFYVVKPATLVMVAVAGMLVMAQRRALARLPASTAGVLAATVVWLIFTIPSFLGTTDPATALMLIASYLLVAVLAFWVLPLAVDNPRDHIRFEQACLLALLVVLTYSVAHGFGGLHSLYFDPATGRRRYTASFMNPNYLGVFSMLAMVTVWRLSILGRRRYLPLLAPLAALLWLSGSRASLGVLAIIALAYGHLRLLARMERKTRLAAVVLVVQLAVLSTVVLAYILIDNFSLSSIDQITSGRIDVWRDALARLDGHSWLLGRGIGFISYSSVEKISRTASFDNYYLNQLVQTGWVGLVGLFIFMLVAAKAAFRLQPSRLKLFTLSVLLGWVVYSAFESAFFTSTNPASFCIWAELGILAGYLSRTRAVRVSAPAAVASPWTRSAVPDRPHAGTPLHPSTIPARTGRPASLADDLLAVDEA